MEAGLRSNLIIALGDLALRFPNVLEPYTGGWRRGWGLLAAQHCSVCLHRPRLPVGA